MSKGSSGFESPRVTYIVRKDSCVRRKKRENHFHVVVMSSNSPYHACSIFCDVDIAHEWSVAYTLMVAYRPARPHYQDTTNVLDPSHHACKCGGSDVDGARKKPRGSEAIA